MNGQRVREIRRRLGLSQSELARLLGVAIHTVSRWEQGLRNPHPLMVKAVEMLAEEMEKKGMAKKPKKGSEVRKRGK